MTQAGKISCPSPKTNKWPLCTAESLPKTPFLCFWPKPSKTEKSQNLEDIKVSLFEDDITLQLKVSIPHSKIS